MKLDTLKLGYAGAITAALGMLVLSILSNLGAYQGAATKMQEWHMFYTTGVGGTFAGMIEAAIIMFIGLYVFGTIYNKLDK